LKPALPKQNADSAKVPDQRSTTTRRYRPTLSTEVMMIGITIVRLIKGLNNTGDSEFGTTRHLERPLFGLSGGKAESRKQANVADVEGGRMRLRTVEYHWILANGSQPREWPWTR
jgi:hypothetical protein